MEEGWAPVLATNIRSFFGCGKIRIWAPSTKHAHIVKVVDEDNHATSQARWNFAREPSVSSCDPRTKDSGGRRRWCKPALNKWWTTKPPRITAITLPGLRKNKAAVLHHTRVEAILHSHALRKPRLNIERWASKVLQNLSTSYEGLWVAVLPVSFRVAWLPKVSTCRCDTGGSLPSQTADQAPCQQKLLQKGQTWAMDVDCKRVRTHHDEGI